MRVEYITTNMSTQDAHTTKQSLLAMARNLYFLYSELNDGDDLPEWCKFKLSASEKELTDITNYLTARVIKCCADSKISSENLQFEIKKSMINNHLDEGLFDFFKKRKKQNVNIQNYFKQLMSTSSASNKNFDGGVTQLFKDCSILISLLEAKGVHKEKRKKELRYNQEAHINHLHFIRSKLDEAYKYLKLISSRTNTSARISPEAVKENKSFERSHNPFSKAMQISNDIKRNEYSKYYYKNSKEEVDRDNMYGIIKMIPIELKIIASKHNFTEGEKNELAGMMAEHLKSILDRLNSVLESERITRLSTNMYADAITIEFTNSPGRYINNKLFNLLRKSELIANKYYSIDSAIFNKSYFTISNANINANKIISIVTNHLNLITTIKNNLIDIKSLKSESYGKAHYKNFLANPDRAANYIGVNNSFNEKSNLEGWIDKHKAITSQANFSSVKDDLISLIGLNMLNKKYLSDNQKDMLSENLNKSLSAYCDKIIATIKSALLDMYSASSGLSLAYDNKEKSERELNSRSDKPFKTPGFKTNIGQNQINRQQNQMGPSDEDRYRKE